MEGNKTETGSVPSPRRPSVRALLLVQIQLMCGAAIINLLSLNASSDNIRVKPILATFSKYGKLDA